MVNQLLRRFSVKYRIAAVLLLLTLTMLISVPLIVINQNFLVGRLYEVTELETQAERQLLKASVSIVESRVNLDRYINRFTQTTKEAQLEVLMAIALVEEARSLSQEPDQIAAMTELIDDLSEYHALIESINVDAYVPNSLSSVPARLFALSQSLAFRVEALAESCRQRVLIMNEAIEAEAKQRLFRLFVSYGLLLFTCIVLILLIGNSITKPIAALHHWALNFRMGQMGSPLSTMGKDELAQLAQTLNDLTERLSTSHSDLEQKVVESTNQISSARAKFEEEALFRRQVQQELAEREHQYSAIFEKASDGILLVQDGKMRYVNPRFAEIFGYRVEELLDTLFEEYLVTDDRPLVMERSIESEHRNSKRPNRFEVTAVHHSGKLINLELNSGTTDYERAPAVLWIVRDVTERKQAEQRLKITQLSIDYAGDAIYWIRPTGRIDYANQMACQLLGYTRAELLTMSLYDIVPHISADKWLVHWERLKKTGMLIFESPHVTKSGDMFPAEVRTNYREIDGQEYIFGFVQNITQRKETQANLQRAKDAAESANAAKSQFLSNMTHELRTPMNGVLGMTSLLYDTPLNSEQKEIIDTIRLSGDTLLNIINEVLDFSKIDAGKVELEMTQFDLRQCIEETLDLVSLAAAKKGIDLVYMIDQDVPRWILQDVTRLRQILANLLSNAIKFTDVGEVVVRVMISSTDRHEINRLTQHEMANANTPAGEEMQLIELTFAVEDTGIGIPTDRMHRLFQSFSQVDASTTRRFGGTGLGLAISKRLAEVMGGKMWVQSQENVGSTFYFSIVANVSDEPNELRSQEISNLNNKRMAICIDSENVQRAVIQYLDSWQAQSTITRDVSAELFELEKPDALIVDWKNFEDARTNSLLDDQMAKIPIVLLTNMIKPKGAYEKFPRVTQLSMPIRASQFQDALSAAIFKDVQVEDAPPVTRARPELALTNQVPSNGSQGMDVIGNHRHPLKILLAEDNLVNQKVALGILRKLGYHADVAANGQEVLDAMARQHYELILMDISMPTMDGIMATKMIRSNLELRQQPYIIAVTANAMPGDRERYMDVGMDDYVSKPIKIEALRSAILRSQDELTGVKTEVLFSVG